MSDSMRDKIIRLAHANPNLRKDLLPLVASHSKTANWWNLVVLSEGRGQFRMTIGAEQNFSDGESSLDAILERSLPRLKKDVYDPIVKALQEHPEIQLYRIPTFKTIMGSTKRKSIIIGWTLSGSISEEINLMSFLKGLGISTYWDIR